MALLEPHVLRQLDRLEILARRVERGALSGDRLSAALGRSLDFAQHAEYAMGDDLRLIDWSVYGRQERLVIKQFEAEADLQLYLLVDRSASMDFGIPTKAHVAAQIAAAIGYISLSGLDLVHAYGLADNLLSTSGGLRGKSQFTPLCRFLEALPVGGKTNFLYAAKEFCSRDPLPGLVVLCTDCWDLKGFQDTIRLLRFHKHEVLVVQIVTDEELHPTLAGDLELIDSETGARQELTVTPGAIAQYEAAVTRVTRTLERFTIRQGGRFFQMTTTTPLASVVRDILRTAGIVGR